MSELESWKILSGIVFFFLIFGFFSIYKSKNLNNLRLSKSITFVSIVYSILAFGVILFTFSAIVFVITAGFNNSKFENFPLINIMLFDLGTICVDLFSILIVLMTFSVFSISFVLSQIGLHHISRNIELNSDIEMSSRLRNKYTWLGNCEILVIDQDQPDAFSFTTLLIKRFNIKIQDWIVISSGLLKLLNDDEIESVLAHEYSHILYQDTRYSHVIFTTTKLIFFDPFLKMLKKYINKKHEFKADMYAAEKIKKPRALAQALAKLLYFSHNKRSITTMGPTAFFDTEKKVIIERINTLLEYADQNNLDQ